MAAFYISCSIIISASVDIACHKKSDNTVPNTHLPGLKIFQVRPCEEYKEEYSDCRSIKAKFHQYFIHGETKDCTQWKTDYDKCLLYRKQKDVEALVRITLENVN